MEGRRGGEGKGEAAGGEVECRRMYTPAQPLFLPAHSPTRICTRALYNTRHSQSPTAPGRESTHHFYLLSPAHSRTQVHTHMSPSLCIAFPHFNLHCSS